MQTEMRAGGRFFAGFSPILNGSLEDLVVNLGEAAFDGGREGCIVVKVLLVQLEPDDMFFEGVHGKVEVLQDRDCLGDCILLTCF